MLLYKTNTLLSRGIPHINGDCHVHHGSRRRDCHDCNRDRDIRLLELILRCISRESIDWRMCDFYRDCHNHCGIL